MGHLISINSGVVQRGSLRVTDIPATQEIPGHFPALPQPGAFFTHHKVRLLHRPSCPGETSPPVLSADSSAWPPQHEPQRPQPPWALVHWLHLCCSLLLLVLSLTCLLHLPPTVAWHGPIPSVCAAERPPHLTALVGPARSLLGGLGRGGRSRSPARTLVASVASPIGVLCVLWQSSLQEAGTRT